MKILGIKEAQKEGLSALVRETEAEGFIILTSNRKPMVLLTPMTLSGLANLTKTVSEVFADAEFQSKLSADDKEIVGMMSNTISKSFSKLLEQNKMFEHNMT